MEDLKENCIKLLVDIKKSINKCKSTDILNELEISLQDILENYFN